MGSDWMTQIASYPCAAPYHRLLALSSAAPLAQMASTPLLSALGVTEVAYTVGGLIAALTRWTAPAPTPTAFATL